MQGVVPGLPNAKEWQEKAQRYLMEGVANPDFHPGEEEDDTNKRYLIDPSGSATLGDVWKYLLDKEYVPQLEEK